MSTDVKTFSADGTLLPALHLADVGLSQFTSATAFIEATGMLLLTDANGASFQDRGCGRSQQGSLLVG
jgi:hypothetical protein